MPAQDVLDAIEQLRERAEEWHFVASQYSPSLEPQDRISELLRGRDDRALVAALHVGTELAQALLAVYADLGAALAASIEAQARLAEDVRRLRDDVRSVGDDVRMLRLRRE